MPGSGLGKFPIVRTPNKKFSALTITMKTHSVKPTMYAIRHGWQNSYYALRHWVFEAKEEGSNKWFVVSEHKEDASIKDGWDAVTFPVRGAGITALNAPPI